MPKISYEDKRFGDAALEVIEQANGILETYEAQGFDLTLRQLYYQFVARDLLPNVERSYKRLGSIVNDARLAGYIDWNHITDRTRNLRELSHWDDPADIIRASARQFRTELWADQPAYVEVWIEKDALVGVIAGVCNELDVPYFSCRGYTSQSEMWGAGQRLGEKVLDGKDVVVLHLGDHDPSGIDMTRDIRDRLHTFIWHDFLSAKVADGEVDGEDVAELGALLDAHRPQFEVERIALSMAQIEEYGPPPNPAKVSDSRYRDYALEYGESSWELDSLDPPVIVELVRRHVLDRVDGHLWDAAVDREQEKKKVLEQITRRWDDVADFLNGDAE